MKDFKVFDFPFPVSDLQLSIETRLSKIDLSDNLYNIDTYEYLEPMGPILA